MKARRECAKCANCGHHRSVHHYDPADEGRHEPRLCGAGQSRIGAPIACRCPGYRRPSKGERVTRLPLDPASTEAGAHPLGCPWDIDDETIFVDEDDDNWNDGGRISDAEGNL